MADHPAGASRRESCDKNDGKDGDSASFAFRSTDTGFTSSQYGSGKNDVYQEGMLHGSRPVQQRARHHVFRFWTWELLSLFVALGLMAATIAILAHFEGQKVPEWPFSINLNTLIALLSTILRAAMLVAVAEVLGQLKYGHFSRPRPLKHLHDFDRASRSVNGSVKLLFVAPKNILAVVAAIVTILSLAIGPFTQQAIRSVTCPQLVTDANASIPIAHFVPGPALYYRIGAGEWEVDTDMKGAMVQGLTNPTGNDSAIVASCPTGNCTFPASSENITHSSIGMCSACMDTTQFVTANTSNTVTNYTLPNNLWLSPFPGEAYLNVKIDYNLTWASSAFPDGFGELASDALTNFTILTFTQSSVSRLRSHPLPDMAVFWVASLPILVATSKDLPGCHDQTVTDFSYLSVPQMHKGRWSARIMLPDTWVSRIMLLHRVRYTRV